jgi:hypothetical protein
MRRVLINAEMHLGCMRAFVCVMFIFGGSFLSTNNKFPFSNVSPQKWKFSVYLIFRVIMCAMRDECKCIAYSLPQRTNISLCCLKSRKTETIKQRWGEWGEIPLKSEGNFPSFPSSPLFSALSNFQSTRRVLINAEIHIGHTRVIVCMIFYTWR